MSSSEDVEAALEIQVHNVLSFMAVTFLYWDHLITLDAEVLFCWRQKKSLSALLFFLNRYFAFFSNLTVAILGNVNLPADGCRRYNLYRQLLLLITQVFVCFLLTLRIYALYGRSKKILYFMYGMGAVLGGVAASAFFGQKGNPAPQPGVGCHFALERGTAVRLAAAWEALFIYDCIIFSLTFYQTYSARHHHEYGRQTIPIISLILRDGAIYFAVMALSNLANILTFYFAGPYLRGGLSTFASSISVTMLSRLMLNLHQSAYQGLFSTPSNSRNTATGEFGEGATIIELDTIWTSEMGHHFADDTPPATAVPETMRDLESQRDCEQKDDVVVPRLPPPPRIHPRLPSIMIHPSESSPGLNTANTTNVSVTFVGTPSPRTTDTPVTAVDIIQEERTEPGIRRYYSYS